MAPRARRTVALFISISFCLAASACSRQSGYVISGRVVDPQRLQPEGAQLSLRLEGDVALTSEVVGVNTDGSFATRRLAAGMYVLQVVRPHSRTHPARVVAFSTVTVSTQDVNGVTVVIRPDSAVHGRFRMETNNPAATWPAYIGVSALLALEGAPALASMAADGAPGGHFWLHNAFGLRVIRTDYRLSGAQWWPTRVLLDGVDITNVPTDFSSSGKSELEVVFTQHHPAHFAFSMLGRDGQPIRNAWVVIVAADRKLWQEWATTTLIRQLYASASFDFATLPGRYLARGFPPDAFPSARAALQQLDRLMTGATPVDLRDRETKMLRLVVQ